VTRTTREVFEDHLALALKGEVETDIERNFAPDCVLLTSDGEFRGHQGIREAARALFAKLPGTDYEYTNTMVAGELAFLEWRGRSARARVDDGADSFIVRQGRIVYMTAHYTVRHAQRLP
jgi:hypothetical protein